jgi:hypothetical protein
MNNLKTFKTNRFPSLIYNTEESAKEDANKHDLSVCRIVYIDEWNGEISEKFMGYGLTDGEKLLGTNDFVWV